MSYYIVRQKTGEVYRVNGTFWGKSKMRSFRTLSNAIATMCELARSYKEPMRVDRDDGQTEYEAGERHE